MHTLREDQEDALYELRHSLLRGHKRVVMQAPTGFGKTLLSAQLVANARAKDKHVLFTVPKIDLVDQTVEMFARQGINDVGVIQAQHELTDWRQPVQIASVQTLQRRTLPQADVVLIDEVHNWFRFYEKWICDPAWQTVPIIGLSATPWTRGLGTYFDDLIIASTTQELIEKGLLSPFKVFAPSHPDLTGIRIVAGDYHLEDLSERMSQKALVADIVQTWLNKAERRPTLCFAVDRDHAKTLQERFLAAGVRAAYQDAKTPSEERRQIRRDFHDGTIELVCNVGTLTTGVDWDVRCIILARPTKSEMLFVQIIGRGLRTAEDKDHCLILDHSDTHLRLGFVTDVDARHDGLDDGKTKAKLDNKEQQVRLPKECPSCGYLKPPRTAKCPNCGHTAQHIIEDEKYKEHDGELKELKNKKSRAYTIEEKAIFLSELKGYGLDRGYKPGWALNKYREKFGVWPDHSIKDVGAIRPGMETASWIKSRQIAWAHSNKNRARSVAA